MGCISVPDEPLHRFLCLSISMKMKASAHLSPTEWELVPIVFIQGFSGGHAAGRDSKITILEAAVKPMSATACNGRAANVPFLT